MSVFENAYVIISSVVFPVLAILWVCCIGCCIYKAILRSLGKEGSSTTKVEVISSE